ncbi:MAG: DUF1593 domain-containing protein [Planctomycetales bacterium]|nr:DUF1593 domain-containing protein [Planctomycetales bacterium]
MRLFGSGLAGRVAFVSLVIQAAVIADDGALTGVRHRVLVSTDIGGTDPDDIQSMVHLLVYADLFDLEGLVSSPYGPGRKHHILDVIDAYEADYPNLKSHSSNYPAPDSLRKICKQGATETPGASGIADSTEGSRWIVECASTDDQRPLHVLVWGGLEDLAQALHDAPEILPRLRVYWIGGPNKKWSVDAYNYIEQHHPGLWMIEANATYRGWFVGGDQTREWENQAFVRQHVAGHGALGQCFCQAKSDLKMGDTPSVARLLLGDSTDPMRPSWGGQFVPIWDQRKTIFDQVAIANREVEVFGVTEFVVPKPAGYTSQHFAKIVFAGSRPDSHAHDEGNALRFRFAPRDVKCWEYSVQSNHAALHGVQGSVVAVPPSLARTSKKSKRHPQWWIDDPAPEMAEGVHPGAKSVNRWRIEFLRDFAQRMDRCQTVRDP